MKLTEIRSFIISVNKNEIADEQVVTSGQILSSASDDNTVSALGADNVLVIIFDWSWLEDIIVLTQDEGAGVGGKFEIGFYYFLK